MQDTALRNHPDTTIVKLDKLLGELLESKRVGNQQDTNLFEDDLYLKPGFVEVEELPFTSIVGCEWILESQ